MSEIILRKIKPVFNAIVTTAERHTQDVKTSKDSTLIDAKKVGALKEYQTVIAVGDSVKVVKPGDVIMINPNRYAVHKYKENSIKSDVMTDEVQYRFNMIEVDEKPCLLLYDSDISYIILEKDEVEETESKLIKTASVIL